MRPIIRATTSPVMTEREEENYALARKVAAEGMVLLENNGALPLKTETIALYGTGARHPSFGGTGSGENNPRYQITPEQGLLDAGLKLTTEEWLADFDEVYETEYRSWLHNLQVQLKRLPQQEQFPYSCAHGFVPPQGRNITQADVESSGTDTAVYILTRIAGEGKDRETRKGDWYLTDEEKNHLKMLRKSYQHVILVLNCGGIIDLSPVDDIGVDAILYAMQGGMEFGHALADVLTGKISPSGKLTDTWAKRYEDYPGAEDFAGRNGDPLHEVYREGIYVGYRWFDIQNIKPRYAFGYGLSYAEFSREVKNIDVFGSHVVVNVIAKNVSEEYSGQDVLELYLSAPNGELAKERKSLVAFGKTGTLLPGYSEEVKLEFELRDFASYDTENGRFLLEGGNYVLQLGSSAADVQAIGTLFLDEDAVTEVTEHVCKPKETIQWSGVTTFLPHAPVDPVMPVKSGAIFCEEHQYGRPEIPRNTKTDFVLGKLSAADRLHLTIGTSYVGKTHNYVAGASGTTTSKFVGEGIENMPMADGPAGLNLTPQFVKPLVNLYSYPVMPEALRFGANKVMSELRMPLSDKDPRTVYYQYATAWPCETVVAQTWDVNLVKKMGQAIGEEMEEFGIAFWLAPGMNIHRNPLCGRNFEYYSEDPYLTGCMASAITRGVQSHDGCFVTLKHFACNNQETERNRVDVQVDERALREIYLKGFRMAVKAGARGVMSSYNKINGVYSPNNYDLLTKVLRNEWGFQGIVMTDWFAAGHDDCKEELCLPAGNDLIMPGSYTNFRRVAAAIRENKINPNDLARAAWNIASASVDCCVSSERFEK